MACRELMECLFFLERKPSQPSGGSPGEKGVGAMKNKRTENWDAGDFGRHFRGRAAASSDGAFREEFARLAETLEPMDREFCRETAKCGRDLSSVIEELEEIAGREGYCERPRGFEAECGGLYQDVDRAIAHIAHVREECFL